uniref:Uncharacterized protein n=1 Tax=Hyaloperonospora arabidopsidis (strain Emoy2) TaxID=559515 RepID=M4BLR6_HYAAE
MGGRMFPKKPCFYFQREGRCRFGDSCRFVHGRAPDNVVLQTPFRRENTKSFSSGRQNHDVTLESVGRAPPFSLTAFKAQLTEKLASSTFFSGHSDTLVCFWPGANRLEVLWKGFLMPHSASDPWPVNSQTQALNFVNSGLYALTNDNIAPKFVRELGKTEGRGLLVIQELLNLTYSNDAGRGREVVSFQRGLVPFVTMLTMRRMEMVSRHMSEANHVYAFMRTAHVQLFQLYLKHLEQMVERHSIDDYAISHETFLQESDGQRYAPLCFTQVCLPLIRLLYLLGSKFNDFIYEDAFQETVKSVDALTTTWKANTQGGDSALDSRLCFKVMTGEVTRLHKMIRRGERDMHTGATRMETERKVYGPGLGPWDVVDVGMPEEAVLTDGSVGPRHDNDHRDIRDIQLLPTTEECLSRERPLLPGNFPFHENAHWLPPGPERWIDTHFRLYREDFCGTIRSSLQDLYHRLVENREHLVAGRLKGTVVDYNVYPIIGSVMPLKHTDSRGERDYGRRTERYGLCIEVQFQQPSAARLTGRNKLLRNAEDDTMSRRELWEKTGRLPYKGMVALVTHTAGDVQVIFCQIVERDVEKLVKDVVEVTLQPFEIQDFSTLEQWQHFALSGNDRRQGRLNMLLLEFNNIFLAAYGPVLRTLQCIRPTTLPLLEYLAPETPPTPGETQMESPMYCSKDGFTFDLSSVLRTHPNAMNGGPDQLRLQPLERQSREACETALVRYSTLERDQAKALVEALSSRVACIQGLPGSGKSFIGAMLTRIILEAKISPILIVCYTNHALDQFLCHLLDAGITKLVRIGGQCKEPRLEDYNLKKMPKDFQRYELKLLYNTLDENADAIALKLKLLNEGTRRPTWTSLKQFLETNYPDTFDYFLERYAELYDDDWDIAGCSDILDYWIQGMDIIALHRRDQRRQGANDWMQNLWMWSLPKRQAALAEWVSAMRGELVEELIEAQEAYQETMNKIETVRDQADIDILTRVQIIGMTTTGVAQNQRKIAAVEPLVVICEEAGEVLEAQLMACLSPACQQLVLIGDHKQLRPHISEYNLSVESDRGKRFALDVSLFERLVSPSSGLPFWMLTEQHRMRPQISQLIRMLFYPKVRDARETLEYPSLLGVNKNVFFVTHDHPEGDTAAVVGTPSRSHSNEYEVAYIVATLIYLLQQGYRTSDIAILTPYVGQLIKLRSALRGKFTLELNELDLDEIHRTSGDENDDSVDDVMVDAARTNSQASLGAVKIQLSGEIRAATIDNFQGEEATIILASLVRSNTNAQGRGSIGFLKTPNRINVLLSRAKHGLILVGHGDLLRTKSPLWCQVIDQLQNDKCYGTGLPLKCQRHSDDLRFATNPGSFAELAPDGGCLRSCGKRLPKCGHACPKCCHVDQPSHAAVYCTQPCPRLQPGCEHVCPGICGDPCGRCEVRVGSLALPCGHTYDNARCFEAKKLARLRCNAMVEKIVLSCGHVQRVACSTVKVKCTRLCGAVLPCGHACSRKCSDCIDRTLMNREDGTEPNFPIAATEHGDCQKECERVLPCCHRCRGICHGTSPCPPCQRICDVFKCEHGSCNHPCCEPCTACTESCTWSCEHRGTCDLPCGAPCNRRLCDRRCTKSLECGHQCPSVCGEDCPTPEYCQVCGDDNIKERVADVIMFRTYGEVDPSEDPVLVLSCCSMVYTMETLDGTLHMGKFYDSNGNPRGPLPGDYMSMPQCPNCSKPIRNLRRYGRVTKRAAIDSADKNFISHAQRQLIRLQERTNAAIENGSVTDDRTLRHDLRSFGVTVKRPPCQKVYEACVALVTKGMGGQGGGDVYIDSSTLPVPNSSFQYLGHFYLLSAQLSMLGDNISTRTRAQQYARQAVDLFAEGSFEVQAREARLLLVQILLADAEAKLSKTVENREERKKAVEKLATEACELLRGLRASGSSFMSRHGNDVELLGQRLVRIIKRASSATYYQSVSMEEMKLIKMAMQTEFRGSGHWYRCINGHSYSIGECGMAMEETRCPECGAPVGGAHHQFVEGTVRDEQMEAIN